MYPNGNDIVSPQMQWIPSHRQTLVAAQVLVSKLKLSVELLTFDR